MELSRTAHKNTVQIAIALALVSSAIPVFGGEVSIPNTFVNGQTADADQVNANFDAVKNAVDGNASTINALEELVSGNSSQLSTLHASLESAQTAIRANNTGIEDNSSKLSSVEGSVDNNSSAISSLDGSLSSVQTDVDNNRSDIEENSAAISSAQDSIKSNESTLNELRSSLLLTNNSGEPVGNVLGVRSGFRYYEVLTKEGFFASVYRDGSLGSLSTLFDGPDCTGNAYLLVRVFAEGRNSAWIQQGRVFTDTRGSTLYYAPSNPDIIPDVTLQSTLSDFDGCRNSGTSGDVIQLRTNDVGVTGVPEGGFAGPVQLQR